MASGVIVHENECLWCYNFQTSLRGWPTHSADESDAFPVLFWSSLLLVHILPWTMCKRPVANTVMTLHTMIFLIVEISVHWLLTCPFAIFCSPYLKFLCPILSFSFHQLRQFLLLERLPSAHTNCQQASTNCPCTDTETALRQLCTILLTRLLPVSVALPHQNRVISCYLPHLPFLSAVNFLPPEIFLRILLTDETLTLFFLQYPYQNSLPGVKFVLWYIFCWYNQLFSPFGNITTDTSSRQPGGPVGPWLQCSVVIKTLETIVNNRFSVTDVICIMKRCFYTWSMSYALPPPPKWTILCQVGR